MKYRYCDVPRNPEELAQCLAEVLRKFSRAGVSRFQASGKLLVIGPLAMSEMLRYFWQSPRVPRGKPTLPDRYARALRESPQMRGFQPRGRVFQDIPTVACLEGHLLSCLDPDRRVEDAVFLSP